MAIFAKGADPEALVQSAQRLKGLGAELDDARSGAGSAITVLKGQWTGGDLERLMGRWPAVEHQLTQARSTLDQLSEAVARNARDQTRTSTGAAAGGGAPGAPGGAPGAGGRGGKPEVPLVQTILKDAYSLVKAPLLLKNPLLIANFLKNLDTWDGGLGLIANAKAVWASDGALGELGRALDATKLAEIGKVVPFIEDGGRLAGTLGTVGKLLGPVGAAFSAVNTLEDFAQGNETRGYYDAAMTAVSVAACFPPATVVAAPLAAAMGVGELVYDHWDAISSFAGDAGDVVGDVAADAGHVVSDGWHALFGDRA